MKRDSNERQDPQQLEKVRKTLRGRAEKACVRCRAKKRTCDGGQPCQRCKESHSACYFSDWHYTVPYPREYVEYLEEQQEQLSSGLMTMYRLLKESHITTIPPLPEKPQAQDLLAALRGLRLDKNSQTSNRSHGHTNGNVASFVATQPESRPQNQVMASSFDAASRSPTQPTMYMPSFPSVPMSHAPGPPTTLSTSMPGSFVPLTYATFDYTRATHAPMQAQSSDQGFSPMHATTPVFGQLPANGLTSPSEGWHLSQPSSANGAQISPRTAATRSPQSFVEDHGGGSDHQNHILNSHHEHMMNNNHHEHMMNNHHQNRWNSWPTTTGQTDVGLGYYGNNHLHLETPHDASLGIGLESIGQNGGITHPPDSHAR